MKEIPQLDGLRALAIAMVFLHHAVDAPLMWAGVDLFFILSGYLITGILLRDSERMAFRPMMRRFYVRRAERILPAYVVALALIVLVTHPPLAKTWWCYTFFLQNLPYAFGWTSTWPLVPMWSLAVEQHFYLVWPLVVFFLPRRWLAPGMLALLVAEPVLRAACTPLFPRSEAIYVLTPFRLDAMAAGAWVAIMRPRLPAVQCVRWGKVALVAGVALYAFLAHYPWFRRGANDAVFNSLSYTLNIMVFGGLFLWALFSENGSPLVRVLSMPWARFLGRISYMFYLLHMLVLHELVPHVASPWSRGALAFALTTAMATLSWYAIERPVLRLSPSHRAAAAARGTA